MVLKIFFLFCLLTLTAKTESEAFYQDLFNVVAVGKVEVRLPDGTRCDVVTETHAIEVEFARKWCEGFGQSLWYGFQLNKKPGICLILESEKDRRFLIRLNSLIAHQKLDLKVWTIDPEGNVELGSNE